MNMKLCVCKQRVGLLSLLFCAVGYSVFATEVVRNNSFDDGTNYWQVAPEVLATNPTFNAISGGQAGMHVSGYNGVVYFQDLNRPVSGGAACMADVTLTRNASPAGNTIAVYLDYLQADGQTNRMTLFNPNNYDVTSGTMFTNSFVLPAAARTLLRLSLAKLGNGDFVVLDVSLDAPPALQDPHIIQNGDFETGTPDGWPGGVVTNAGARNGTYATVMNGWGPPAFRSQEISARLRSGVEYMFTAWINVVSNMNGMGMPAYVPHLSVGDAIFSGSTNYYVAASNSANLGWQRLELRRSFTAAELATNVYFSVGGMGLLLADDLGAVATLDNNGFECGSLTNWQYSPVFSVTNAAAHGGTFAARADCSLAPHSFVSQNIAPRLKPGVEYKVSAWVSLTPGDYNESTIDDAIPHLGIGPDFNLAILASNNMAVARRTVAGWQKLELTRIFTAGELSNDVFVGVAKMEMTGTFMVDDLLVTPITPFDQVMRARGLSGDDAEPMADPHHVGVPNLAVFAFGLNPTNVNKVDFPAVNIMSNVPGLTFRQRAGGTGTPGALYVADGVSYVVQYSTDLASGGWNSAASQLQLSQRATNSDGTETVTLSFSAPANPGSAKFVRVQVGN